MLLNRRNEDIYNENGGSNELCWCHLMEEWLYSEENLSYPASWEGLYSLLEDAEASTAANLLKNAIICAIHPPPKAKVEVAGNFLELRCINPHKN